MPDRQVSAITAKVWLDATDLEKADKKAQQAGANIKSSMVATKAHTDQAGIAFKSLAGDVEKVIPSTGKASAALQGIIGAGSSVTGVLGAVGLGAGAAAAAIGVFALEAGAKYAAVAATVHDYMIVTGQSADAASRQVEVFGILGVSADTASGAMVKLEKAIETQPKKLQDMGVEVARNAQGNVDMGKTLLNVADAYNATSDAAKKMDIVLTAFGKSGAAMIPVLEQGSASLRKMEADAKLVMTDADVEQARKYAIQQKQIAQNWDAMMASMGRYVDNLKGSVSEAYVRGDYVARKMSEAEANNTDGVNNNRVARAKLTAQFTAEFDASQKAKLGLDAHAEAMKKAAEAAATLAKAIDDATNAVEASASSSVRAERANIALYASTDKIVKAQDTYNQVVKQFGAASEQAITASHDLRSANLDQEDAARGAADAARTLAMDLVGPGASAADKATAGAEAYVAKLKEERDSLGPGSALRTYLDQYIARLAAVPANVGTTITTTFSSADSQTGRGARAGGGPVVPGGVYDIGEQGRETLVMGASGGYVIPNAGGGGGGANGAAAKHYNLTLVGTPVVNDPDGVRRMLQRMELLGTAG